MTILNVHVSPQRALVGMDTRVVNTVTGIAFDSSKFGILPESNVLFAWRGDRNVHANIFAQFFCARDYVDFDVVQRALPEILPQVIDAYCASYAQAVAEQNVPPELVDSSSLRRVELVVAGWSKACSAMTALLCEMAPESSVVHVKAIVDHLAPKNCLADDERASVGSIGAMERTARLQFTRISEGGYGDQGFGGDFLIAELSRDEFRVRRRRIFPAS